MMPNSPAIRPPILAGAGFAAATLLAALLALILFVLHLNDREPALLDYVAFPILFALIGILGGGCLFRRFSVGARFGIAFAAYPLIARTLYQLGRTFPYGGVALDLITSFYFAILLPALTCGVIGAIGLSIAGGYRDFIRRGFAAFAIAGAIGGMAAPLISWMLAQMAAESALAATLSIYGEELLRFFLAGAGLALVLRRASADGTQ